MIFNHGKYIFKIFLIIFFIQINLNANVKLTAPNDFYTGEQVVFSISASGANIEFPNIDEIDDFIVQNAGTSSSTSIINGVRSQKLKRTYAFIPTKNVTIPSYSIKIDGKIIKTNPKNIYLKEIKKTTSDKYDLTLEINKKDIYVGEDIVLKLTFKYKKDLPIVDLQFTKPSFEDFWVKELKTKNKQYNDGKYAVQELNYLLFPQKSGNLTINPLKIGIVTMDNRYSNYGFFTQNNTKITPVYSNKIDLSIKKLPENTKLIGDFEIKSSIDKTSVSQGDAVSYNITIQGRGNLDDIDEIKLNIPNTTVYDNPATKQYNLKNSIYGGTYKKTYSIVGSSDFKIPVVELKYFDKNTKTIKTKYTKEYNIKIKGIKKQKPTLEVSNKNYQEINQSSEKSIIKVIKTTDNQKIIYFLSGILVGLFIFLLYTYISRTKKEKHIDTSLEKKVKSSKTIDELLNILVVYINIDNELDKIIYTLEDKNKDIKFKQIKKEILKTIKDKKLDIQL